MQYTVDSERKIALTTFAPNRQDNEDEFTRFDPVMNTGVPPVSSPRLGIRVRIVEGASSMKNLPDRVKSILLSVISNVTIPGCDGGERHSNCEGEMYRAGTTRLPKRQARPAVLRNPLPATTTTVPPL